MTKPSWDGDPESPMLDRWDKRLSWCSNFREVVQILEELECPLATDVGMAHLTWRRNDRHRVAGITIMASHEQVGFYLESLPRNFHAGPADLKEACAFFVTKLRGVWR